jgi:hypothetical protein
MFIELTQDSGRKTFVNMDNVTDFSALEGELTVIRTNATDGEKPYKIRVRQTPQEMMNLIVDEQRRLIAEKRKPSA